MGSGFECVWGLTFVFGDFRRKGTFGVLSSTIVCKWSSKQVDLMVVVSVTYELFSAVFEGSSISYGNVKWQAWRIAGNFNYIQQHISTDDNTIMLYENAGTNLQLIVSNVYISCNFQIEGI